MKQQGYKIIACSAERKQIQSIVSEIPETTSEAFQSLRRIPFRSDTMSVMHPEMKRMMAQAGITGSFIGTKVLKWMSLDALHRGCFKPRSTSTEYPISDIAAFAFSSLTHAKPHEYPFGFGQLYARIGTEAMMAISKKIQHAFPLTDMGFPVCSGQAAIEAALLFDHTPDTRIVVDAMTYEANTILTTPKFRGRILCIPMRELITTTDEKIPRETRHVKLFIDMLQFMFCSDDPRRDILTLVIQTTFMPQIQEYVFANITPDLMAALSKVTDKPIRVVLSQPDTLYPATARDHWGWVSFVNLEREFTPMLCYVKDWGLNMSSTLAEDVSHHMSEVLKESVAEPMPRPDYLTVLSKAVAEFEGTPSGVLTSSGMSAMALAITYGLNSGEGVLAIPPVYDCNRELMGHFMPQLFGIRTTMHPYISNLTEFFETVERFQKKECFESLFTPGTSIFIRGMRHMDAFIQSLRAIESGDVDNPHPISDFLTALQDLTFDENGCADRVQLAALIPKLDAVSINTCRLALTHENKALLTEQLDAAEEAKFLEHFGEFKPAKLFFEPMGNPTCRLLNTPRLIHLALHYGAREVVIDNTFLTARGLRIMDSTALSRDEKKHVRIAYSGTKHLDAGYSADTWGWVSISQAEETAIQAQVQVSGIAMANCAAETVVLQSLPSLNKRIQKQFQNTIEFVEFLKNLMVGSKPLVKKICFPTVDETDKARADKQLSGLGYGSVFYIEFNDEIFTPEKMKRFLDTIGLQSIFRLAVSLGKPYTLIENSWFQVHALMPPAQKLAAGITPNGLRVAIGCEAIEDIIREWTLAMVAALAMDPDMTHVISDIQARFHTQFPDA